MRMLCVPTVSDRCAKAAAFILFGLLSVGTAAAVEQGMIALQAQQIQWTADNASALQRLFNNARVVRTFLNEIAGEGDAREPGMIGGDVKEYQFIDLNKDGRLELVALADVSGRGFYNNLEIVYSRPDAPPPIDPLTFEFRGFVLKNIDGFGVDTLASTLKDLDGDGRFEFLVPEPLEQYQGAAKPVAVLPEVYRWNGHDYEKASARYPTYYRNVVLPRLERELRELDSISDDTLKASDKQERRLKRDKVVKEIAAAHARMR